VLNEIMAKITARERMFGIGAIVLVVAWLVGLILASKEACASFAGQTVCSGVSINYFTHEHGTDLGLLALLAALAGIAVIYLKYAPNMKINWPAPFPVIFLAIGGVAVGAAALMFVLAFLDAKDFMSEVPLTMWIADIGMVVGGALMAWPAYQDWTATKTA
jgi:hypothetical protein